MTIGGTMPSKTDVAPKATVGLDGIGMGNLRARLIYEHLQC